MAGHPPTTLLVRLAGESGQPAITVQNLKTGELLRFDSWRDFVSYAKNQQRPQLLR